LVELKAITKLEDVHFAQAINYLKANNLEIGLLINFGETSLNFKRLSSKKFKSKESQKTLVALNSFYSVLKILVL
jgi:hypothetical protein